MVKSVHSFIRIAGLFCGICVVVGGLGFLNMFYMPGRSFRGNLPPLTQDQKILEDALRRDVEYLSGEIGERNTYHHASLMRAAEFIERSLTDAGYAIARQRYEVEGLPCDNLEAELRGKENPEEIVVIGAHYDSVIGSPGANDNATGVAGVFALARVFVNVPTAKTLRFVAFVNEEPMHFKTDAMGSLVYARRAKSRGERVVAMLSLETIGYYSEEPHSQQFPSNLLRLFYPSKGNFVAFVSNLSSRTFLRQTIGAFRQNAQFPSEGLSAPEMVPGVGWSDHWAFWQVGYPGIMVTDTAPYRYPYYHTQNDTPDKIDYGSLARVISGLKEVLAELSGSRVENKKRSRISWEGSKR